jgi:hypothetical protein
MEEPTQELTYEAKIRQSPEFVLWEMSLHFDRANAVWQTLRRFVCVCDENKLAYSVIGAMALYLHGYERATTNVNVIMSKDDLELFRGHCVDAAFMAARRREAWAYKPVFQGAMKSFRDTDTRVKIEVILAGIFPGDGKPKPVLFPDPSEI